ncbi:MAG: hypothetical protein NC402_06470 [Prevotella sp.]|nr:hypothetical protein [Prevotella sp.]MCM1075345.1 hypothetical protein [Ruminococcus sp.]
MSANIPDILKNLGGNLKLLTDKYLLVKAERDSALAECQELKEQVQKLTALLEQANTQIEYLRISHKVAPTQDDVLRSRILITELVKKVDKCIAQLRND